MSESSSSSEEEYVDTSLGDMPANDSPSLKKTVGGSAENEVSVAKRPREGEEAESIVEKRVNKNNFERVWSEEDEIKLLEGVLDHKKENANEYIKRAYEEVSKSISFDVSKIQYKEKLRSLKKKFDRKIIKAKKKGEDPTFVKHHDVKVFELSNLLWGGNGGNGEKPAVIFNGQKSKKRRSEDDHEVMNKELVAEERDRFIKSSVVEALTRFGMDEISALQGWSWISIEDKRRLEEQWKSFQLQKVELHSQKVELYSKESSFIQEVMTKVGEAFKSNL